MDITKAKKRVSELSQSCLDVPSHREKPTESLKRKRESDTDLEEDHRQSGSGTDCSEESEPDLGELVDEILTDKFGNQFVEIAKFWVEQHAEAIFRQVVATKMQSLIQTQSLQQRDLTQFPAKKPSTGPQRRLL